MAAYVAPEFNEELFSVMLESCSPSRARVEALTQVALRHLAQATDTWSALRKALVRQQELESDENKALWYLLDSLMKHAPHVFIPLIAPRLHDYVVQQMPWHLAGVISTMGTGALWCDAMIRTWEGLLPPHLFRSIKSFVVQLRSGKELANAMDLNDDSDEVQTIDPPATLEQMQQMREMWEVFRSFALEGTRTVKETPQSGKLVSEGKKRTGGVNSSETEAASWSSNVMNTVLPVQVKKEPGAQIRVKLEEVGDNEEEDDDDSDVEYMPEFVRGAKQRELPSLSNPNDGTNMQRTRRAARRRPREED